MNEGLSNYPRMKYIVLVAVHDGKEDEESYGVILEDSWKRWMADSLAKPDTRYGLLFGGSDICDTYVTWEGVLQHIADSNGMISDVVVARAPEDRPALPDPEFLGRPSADRIRQIAEDAIIDRIYGCIEDQARDGYHDLSIRFIDNRILPTAMDGSIYLKKPDREREQKIRDTFTERGFVVETPIRNPQAQHDPVPVSLIISW